MKCISVDQSLLFRVKQPAAQRAVVGKEAACCQLAILQEKKKCGYPQHNKEIDENEMKMPHLMKGENNTD